MLEVRNYRKAELVEMLGTRDNEGLKRKLKGYEVEFTTKGRGENIEFSITKLNAPFKVYCITELGLSATTAFDKLLLFLYYFLNDEEFSWLPDETIEARLEVDFGSKRPSRQTIGGWKKKLSANYVLAETSDFTYYFALHKTQILTDKATYCKAWREYFEAKQEGLTYEDAISMMICNYGGVARKQAVTAVNAFYFNELNKLVTESMTLPKSEIQSET